MKACSSSYYSASSTPEKKESTMKVNVRDYNKKGKKKQCLTGLASPQTGDILP
jgi:hypothetical protein